MSRRVFYAIGFGTLMLSDTWTQIAFKLASFQTGPFAWTLDWLKSAALTPWIYGAIAGYVCSFITWMTLLKHAPVGPAFAASHLEVVPVLLISVPLFGERLTALQLGAAGCIVLGVILLGVSESRQHDA